MESVTCNGVTIYYSVTRKSNKNLYARLDEGGYVKITAPYLVSKKTIEKFVVESYFKLQNKISKKKNKSIINDDKIKVLGVSYNKDEIEDINYFLTYKLKGFIKDNYVDICNMMGITNIPTLRFKRVKGYLGQYNKKEHLINLNILIGHLDEECIKYVIIHELAHTRYMNHQEKFWQEVERYCPNYKKLRLMCRKEFVYYENY